MTRKFVMVLVAAAACNGGFHWSSSGGTTPSSSASSPSSSSSSSSPTSGGGLTGGDKPFAATATSSPETWKRYDVRGVQLGQTRKSLADRGFTCGKRANSRCYKIMDKRCDSGRCELKEDAFGQWFELNGAKTSLDYMSCATTETESALVYDCHLLFGPRQVVARDTALGKALIAKYGDATQVDEASKEDKVGGGRMLWWNEKEGSNAPNISVDCNGTNMEGPQCSLDVSDSTLLQSERAKQLEIDDKRKRSAQTAAPAL